MQPLKSIITGLLLFILLSFSPVWAQEDIHKTFTGIEKLELQVGAIEVNYQGKAGKTDISLEALLSKGENSERSLIMVKVGNTLKISYNPPKNGNNSKRFINLEGPESIALDLQNSSGTLLVSDVVSDFTKIRVSSGQVVAKNIVGDLEARGTSGKVTLKNVDGHVDCSLTSGIAELEDINGNLDFKATSGMVKAKGITGILNARLTSGNIRLEDVGELGSLEITSGNIKAIAAGLGSNTVIKGSSGNIDISTGSNLSAFNFDLKAGSGNLRVGDRSNAKYLSIENGAYPRVVGNIGSGSIQIRDL